MQNTVRTKGLSLVTMTFVLAIHSNVAFAEVTSGTDESECIEDSLAPLSPIRSAVFLDNPTSCNPAPTESPNAYLESTFVRSLVHPESGTIFPDYTRPILRTEFLAYSWGAPAARVDVAFDGGRALAFDLHAEASTQGQSSTTTVRPDDWRMSQAIAVKKFRVRSSSQNPSFDSSGNLEPFVAGYELWVEFDAETFSSWSIISSDGELAPFSESEWEVIVFSARSETGAILYLEPDNDDSWAEEGSLSFDSGIGWAATTNGPFSSAEGTFSDRLTEDDTPFDGRLRFVVQPNVDYYIQLRAFAKSIVYDPIPGYAGGSSVGYPNLAEASVGASLSLKPDQPGSPQLLIEPATGNDLLIIEIADSGPSEGSLEVTLSGIEVEITVSAGQSAADIALNLAASINADPALSAAGVTALALDGVVTTTAPVEVTSIPAGLLINGQLGGVPVSATEAVGALVLLLLMLSFGICSLAPTGRSL